MRLVVELLLPRGLFVTARKPSLTVDGLWQQRSRDVVRENKARKKGGCASSGSANVLLSPFLVTVGTPCAFLERVFLAFQVCMGVL